MCHNFFYQSPFWTFELLPNILKRKEGCDGNASYIKEGLGNMVKPSDQTSTLFSNSFFLLWKWCPSEFGIYPSLDPLMNRIYGQHTMMAQMASERGKSTRLKGERSDSITSL